MEENKHLQPTQAPLGSVEPNAFTLNVPPNNQLLYKMMTIENLLHSITDDYLHFNRVDKYYDFSNADQNDGQQLPKDQQNNTTVRFIKSPGFSLANFYDQSRARTYACCFSMENSDYIWSNYANSSEKDKVCIVFNFGKMRSMLNQTMKLRNAAIEYNGIQCKQIFSINYGIVEYVDWNSHQTNAVRFSNPIKYTYTKDMTYSNEKELRISLSALGIGRFVLI